MIYVSLIYLWGRIILASTILEAIFLLINPSNPELPLKISNFRDINVFKPENWDLLFL